MQITSDANGQPHLKRELKARHLTMIAIGGAIGTGLFVASGATVATAGPGGALLAYLLVGVMVYFLMTSLGELAAFMPVPGSFSTYGAHYVEPGFGFALGWNYWYNWAVTVAVDLTTLQIIMHYWFPNVPGFWWAAIFLAIIFLLNYISVRGFGEGEYWFALIKVLAVVFFIAVGTLMIFGIMHGGEQGGLHNFTVGDAPFVGGMPALIGVAIVVGFSFQGTELIGIAAGESENPRQNVPKAVKQVFWRILLFYVLAILIIGLLIPYTDPNLLSSSEENIAMSPFAIVFERAGLAFGAAVLNAVILTSVLSAGNSGMYASTRMLFAMACEGKAPKMFAKLSKNGVPRNALYATTVVAMLCFLTAVFSEKLVFFWLVGMSGMTGFIAWLGIAVSHYRFRKGYVLKGNHLEDLPYRAKLFPFGPLFAFALCLIIMLGQRYEDAWEIISGLWASLVHGTPFVMHNGFEWADFIGAYVGIPLFLVIWIGYRIKHKTRLIRYEDMEFVELTKN
ncbi:amino acid permease [Uliginosibacterium sp. sgz301328]|uniref:amino acid permease n=1 Tax=Uliginosibacterium sp. sgz301328 TaxID=3243764 RepID=UPI00359D0C7F